MRQYDYKQSYKESKRLFLNKGFAVEFSLLLLGFEAKDSTKKSIFDLVAASFKHLFLDEFPVFAVGVEQFNELQVLLESPLLFAQVRAQVVFIMVLELLMIPI